MVRSIERSMVLETDEGVAVVVLVHRWFKTCCMFAGYCIDYLQVR